MKVAVLKERFPGERRVALTPQNVTGLKKAGLEVFVETGAGLQAGFADQQYRDKGAEVAGGIDALECADIFLQVRSAGSDDRAGEGLLSHLRPGKTVIGACEPLDQPQALPAWADAGVTLFSLELIPRITRAQSMDILSSQATIAGYRAVLLAAMELPKIFPMMMTAAGTLTAARVFVIGAGVAGLQSIATARKLGAIVHAYDIRPAVKEQVESLGAKFVELSLTASDAQDQGGYAKAMDEKFYQMQRELMAGVVGQSDVVITTAAIPGRRSPLLVTAEAVRAMPHGGVIVDLASQRGGNCELTIADQRVQENGIVILGPTNLPSEVPTHASQMFGNNVQKYLLNMVREGQLRLDMEDEIIRETLVTHEGRIAHEHVRKLLPQN
jgi:H+-translocating NAD(P) transhydrogenase subunit alpha